MIKELNKAFIKVDKKKIGAIKPNELGDVFRMSGQNPTNEEVERMLQDAVDLGTHMLMFNDIIPIVEKYWKNYDNYVDDLKQACSAFDKSEMGIINFEDLSKILMTYGDKLDEDDIYLMRKAFNVQDEKLIVDDLIKVLSPLDTKEKKGKSAKKGGKKSAKKAR